MQCPNPQCQKENPAVKIDRQPAVSDKFSGTVRCVAYSCEACGTILGVESDPLERNAQMEEIRKAADETKRLVDQITRRFQLVLAQLKNSPPQ